MRANDLADQVAKQGAARHRFTWENEEIGNLEAQYDYARQDLSVMCCVVSEVLALWPRPKDIMSKIQRTVRPRPRKLRSSVMGHRYVWKRGVWQCTRCLQRRLKESQLGKGMVCPGVSKLNNVIRNPKGHNLFLGKTRYGPVLWCNECGAHAQTNIRNLAGNCLKHRAATRKNCKWFDKSVHPDYKYAIWDQTPLSLIRKREQVREGSEAVDKDQDVVRLVDGKVTPGDDGLPLRFWEEWQ